jgi:DNA-binding MarR family transcriptional regulator
MSASATDAEAKHSLSLTDDDVDAITRLLSLLLQQTGRRAGADPKSISKDKAASLASAGRGEALARASEALAERKRRANYFAKVLFSEPGWDMLLELYVGRAAGRRHTVGSLIEVVGNPSTTSIRWINYLEKEKLIEREPHPKDRRVLFIRLTDKARLRLDEYFTEL